MSTICGVLFQARKFEDRIVIWTSTCDQNEIDPIRYVFFFFSSFFKKKHQNN